MQEDAARPPTRIIRVPLRMMSAYLVLEEGVIVVDTGYPGSEETILEKLRETGSAPEGVTLILLTHCHADHAGSAAALRQRTGARIAIHCLDAENLRNGLQGQIHPLSMVGRLTGWFFEREAYSRYPACEPDILIKDELDLAPFGVRGRVITTAGHTPGSVSAVLESGDALVGDLINPSILSGKPGLPFWGESEEEIRESVRKVLACRPKQIYLAHGGMYQATRVREAFGP
ncbi:MBL fold metallo-hydrolase [Methanofollis aquaemaris]|uniref:MBL fold metallo-hydrolase n=1 Tax=Methanofollis aquaemaris TaxID=126734 RepID=A0A8A3S4B3_9EURY|nr:MBL fold metallo-hydrolase [Methanofollis aquaemaris]QSZ66476.1 MBL fold metallo-hydrolase [Methanofollis aquaemaris]